MIANQIAVPVTTVKQQQSPVGKLPPNLSVPEGRKLVNMADPKKAKPLPAQTMKGRAMLVTI